MARGVQQQDVWEAADALVRSGEQPTIEKVRLHLGRGSPNTVGPHLKAWFRGLSARLEGASAAAGQGMGGGGGSRVPEALLQAASHLWDQALELAHAECAQAAAQAQAQIDAQREQLALDQAWLDTEMARVRAREADLEAGMQALREQLAHTEARLRQAEQQARELDTSLRQAQSHAATLQSGLDQARQQHQDELMQLRTSHEAAMANAQARHAAHEHRWLSEIDEHRQALKRSRDEADKARRQAETTLAEQQATIGSLRTELEAQSRRTLQAEATAAAQATRAESLEHAIRASQEQWQAHAALQSGQLDDLRGQIHQLQQQAQAREQQLERLTQLLAQSEAERQQAIETARRTQADLVAEARVQHAKPAVPEDSGAT